MPIIVPIEENKVGLATATDARFRAPDYSGSGLEALGSGLTDVGKGGAQLAEALDGLRTHRDDAAIKQAYVGFGNQADPLLHSFFSLNGSAARAALPQVEADLQAAGQAQIDGVGNDRRRAMIAQQITHRVAESVAAARSHAGLQDIADQAQQNQALQDRSVKDALNNIDNPALYEHHIETGKNAARQAARLAGQPPAQGEAAAHGYQSGIHLSHIDARAADDAVGAMVAVRRHGSDMRPDDMRKALTGIAPRFSYERAIADVDAADLAASPFAPQVPKMSAEDLRDRMLVISPDAQQGNLPSLLQRYRGDAARSWAAAAMGPDKLDALIAQRGDGWYQALPQPVLFDVAQHMALLGARSSARPLPSDPTAAATRIVNQPDIDDERRQNALDELNWRLAQSDRTRREVESKAASAAFAIADRHGPDFISIGQVPPAIRRDLGSADIDRLTSRARDNINPQSAPENGPRSAADIAPASFEAARSWTGDHDGQGQAPTFEMHPAAFVAGNAEDDGMDEPAPSAAQPAPPAQAGNTDAPAAPEAAQPPSTPAERATERSLTAWLHDLGPVSVEDNSRLDIGILSRGEESPNTGPATVSSGKQDAGGKSYGTYQLARTKGQVPLFLANEGKHWAPEFKELALYSKEFDAKWEAIGLRDPKRFSAAQAAYIKRVDYDPVIDRTLRDTNVDLTTRSHAIRNAILSLATQMGPGAAGTELKGAALIVHRAVKATLATTRLDEPDFDRKLLESIYDNRVLFAQRVVAYDLRQSENPQLSPKDRKTAKDNATGMQNVIKYRYPRERKAALTLLLKEEREDQK